MYKIKEGGGVIRLVDGASIPPNDGNRDWRKYQDWLSEGNTSDPADPAPALELAPPSAMELRDALVALAEGDASKALALKVKP